MEMWKLSDELSVIDAAILITGNDPSEQIEEYNTNGSEWVQKTAYEGFEPAFKALKNAILSNRLAAALSFSVGERSEYDPPSRAVLRGGRNIFQARGLKYYDHDGLVYLHRDPDWNETSVGVEDIKAWLTSRDIYPAFFFPDRDPDSFMNKDHSRYSAKLACAVAAWKAVTGPARTKTPKQTIFAWVAANGIQYGLGNDEGIVSPTATEEIAKMVNWQTEGGAAKTGGEVIESSPEVPPNPPDNFGPVRVPTRNAPNFEPDLPSEEEDIPF